MIKFALKPALGEECVLSAAWMFEEVCCILALAAVISIQHVQATGE